MTISTVPAWVTAMADAKSARAALGSCRADVIDDAPPLGEQLLNVSVGQAVA